jgi:hypothetical protein
VQEILRDNGTVWATKKLIALIEANRKPERVLTDSEIAEDWNGNDVCSIGDVIALVRR